MKNILRVVLFFLHLLVMGISFAQTSTLVSLDSTGKLVYAPDAKGNTVPDFSGVGYKNGEVALPTVAVVKTVYPVAGDNLANIQNAINEVAAMPIGSDGFRGAILFKAGTYSVSNTIQITTSGIVLRGEGTDTIKGSHFYAPTLSQYTLFNFQGKGGLSSTGSKKTITNSYIPYGTNQVIVSTNTGNFKVGDSILITRTPDTAWITLLTMAQWGWTAPSYVVSFQRKLTAVSGDTLTIDAPMVDIIDTAYSTATVVKYKTTNYLRNCGIENMSMSCAYTSDTAENHAWDGIDFTDAMNCWVRKVDVYYFGYTAVTMYAATAWITVDSCKMIDAKSNITGERRYSFEIDGQRELVSNCWTRNGRHDYVNGGRVAGPNVFYNSTATVQQNDIGPHMRWSTGILFDNIISNANQDVQNRESFGTGHGWAGSQIMFWNCRAGTFILQKPEGDYTNWAIGCTGKITNIGSFGAQTSGIVESNNKRIAAIPSLYIAQLNQRLGIGNKQAQCITYDTLNIHNLGDTDFIPSCAASSGLPITFTSMNPSVATIVNGKIHLVSIGTAIINASQSGDSSFTAAPVYGQLLTVQSPLPVQLKNIAATIKTNCVEVAWTVANEIGIKEYIIERSTENNFSAIGSVNANHKTAYSFVDASPVYPSYYRLKIISLDGSIKYTNSLLVNQLPNHISIYPNPVSNNLTVAGLVGKSTLKITDIAGKTMLEQNTRANSLNIDLSGLKTGTYVLSITDEAERIAIKKFIKE